MNKINVGEEVEVAVMNKARSALSGTTWPTIEQAMEQQRKLVESVGFYDLYFNKEVEK